MFTRARLVGVAELDKCMTQDKLGPTERVYLKLKNEIILQSFGLGGRLMINDLADRYLVSTTPIREALSRLHGEELIDFRCGQGYFSKTPSLQELEDLFDFSRVVLVACLKSCDEISAQEGGAVCAVRQADISLRISRLYCENIENPCAQVAHLIESIAALYGNMMSLSVVKNINARTHFILQHAFGDEVSAQELLDCMDKLGSAIRSRDNESQKVAVKSYHTIIKDRLPILLSNYVSQQYFASS